MSGFNYSKWDNIGDSDSDDEVDTNPSSVFPRPDQLDPSKMLHLEGSRLPPSAPVHPPDYNLPIINEYGPYRIADFASRTDENDPMPPQFEKWWKERQFVLNGEVVFTSSWLRPEVKQLIENGKCILVFIINHYHILFYFIIYSYLHVFNHYLFHGIS